MPLTAKLIITTWLALLLENRSVLMIEELAICYKVTIL